jgi:hypothetical protein
MRVKGVEMPHIYEPLITKELWDKCQAVLKGKARVKFKYVKKPFAFRGLVRCGICGCAMTSEEHIKPSGKVYTYLSCSHYKGNCGNKGVNEKVILEQISDEVLSKLALPPEILVELKEYVEEQIKCRKQILQEGDRSPAPPIRRVQGKAQEPYPAPCRR